MPSRVEKLLPLTRLIVDPTQTILYSGIVVITGLVFGLILPGLLYWHLKVFTADQVVQHLPTSAASRYADHTVRMKNLDDDIRSLEGQIDGAVRNHGSDATKLFSDRAALLQIQDYEVAHTPVLPEGYFLDTLMYVWPLFYVGIGWLLVIFPPSSQRFLAPLEQTGLFVGTYLVYRLPTWVRNLPPLRSTERKVYSYGNLDVSPASFYAQEVQAAIACLLIVLLWTRWVTFIKIWRADFKHLMSEGKFAELSELYGGLFVYWQVCSVVLALAFIPYTIYFWDMVIDIGDKRYLPHALIMHGFWGVSWLLVSIPLGWTWYVCSVELPSQQVVEAKPADSSSDQTCADVGFPIGNWNVVASLVSTVLTFTFPLVKEILK